MNSRPLCLSELNFIHLSFLLAFLLLAPGKTQRLVCKECDQEICDYLTFDINLNSHETTCVNIQLELFLKFGV